MSFFTKNEEQMNEDLLKQVENLIEFIMKDNLKEVYIDIMGLGLPFFDYVSEAIKRKGLKTKVIAIYNIPKTGSMAFKQKRRKK